MSERSLDQKIDALTGTVGSLATAVGTLTVTVEKGFAALEERMEKGFAAAAEDISDINDRITTLATKEDLAAVHVQVTSIERQLRETKAQVRLADLEEEVFGKVRS